MLFFLSGWFLTLLKCWLTDGENHLWQGGREIITWLLSNSTHRQDKNIREDPACQAVSKSCLHSVVQGKMSPPPRLIIPSSSLSFFTYLCLYTSSSLFFFLLFKHTHYAQTHTHQQPSLPLRAECCSWATRSSGGGSQHDQPPCISLSADQRAAKQPETTESARAEHAQQHN